MSIDTDTLPPLPPDEAIIVTVEEAVGMGLPAWDEVAPADIVQAFRAALAAQAAPAEAQSHDAALADLLAARAAPLDGVGNPALYHALRDAEAWLRGFAPMRIVTAQQVPSDADIDEPLPLPLPLPLTTGQIAGARLSMGDGKQQMMCTPEFFGRLLDAAESLAVREAEIAQARGRIADLRAQLDRALTVCRCAVRLIDSSAWGGVSDEDCDLESSVRDWQAGELKAKESAKC